MVERNSMFHKVMSDEVFVSLFTVGRSPELTYMAANCCRIKDYCNN